MTGKRTTSRSVRALRRVAVVTGSRSEYGLLRSTMAAVAAHPRLRLRTVVTGMHLLRRFGSTVRRIEADGWKVDARVPMQRGHDDALDQADGLARGIRGIAKYLEADRTDIVLVLGDRIEAMAGALAATTTGRLLAHIHGGDVAPGDVDEVLRHSITKLAHVHLAATGDAARRIVRLGEQPDRVHVVGAPGLDDLLALARERTPTESRRGALIVQHAYGRSPAVEARAMSAVLRAVRACNLDSIAVYPNTDRGHSGVVRVLRKASKSDNGANGLRVTRSLRREEYLRLLLSSRVLVGNSSSGIIEAGAVGTPCVNVGDRQTGRLRSGDTVIDARETFTDVRRAVRAALRRGPKKKVRTAYGSGSAGDLIAKILAATPLGARAAVKANTF